jgi:hypothetical protein
MMVRRDIARNRVLREVYLVSRKQEWLWTHPFRPALHASRDTSDEERNSVSAVAAEMFMKNAG